MGWWIV